MLRLLLLILPVLSFGSESLNDQFLKASETKSVGVVSKLIKQGADINALNENQESALLVALYSANTPVARWLIQNGINYNFITTNGINPTLEAAHYGHTSVLRELFKKDGLIFTHQNEFGYAVHNAARFGHIDTIKFLISKCPAFLESKNKNGWTPLFFAAYNGHDKLVGYLLGKKAKSYFFSKDNETPLMISLKQRYPKTARLFMNKKTYVPNITNKEGMTPLIIASQSGVPDVLKNLIDLGENLEHRDSYSNTALLWAVEKNQIDVVKILLDLGANIEARNSLEQTPLILAAKFEKQDIIELLLTYNPNTSAMDIDNKTALDYVLEERNTYLIELLENH